MRKLLHRGCDQLELARWPEGTAFRDVAEALRWLGRLDRDDANGRVLSDLCRELGAGDRLKLSHDEVIRLLAPRLVRSRWGLRQAGLSLEPAAAAQLATEPTPAEKRLEDRPSEEEDIFGYLLEEEEASELEAGIEAETEDGELEAALEAEADDGELEALILTSHPGSPPERALVPPSENGSVEPW